MAYKSHAKEGATAVMDACGLCEVQADRSQVHYVLPETLIQFRRRTDPELMDTLLAVPAAATMETGLINPAHLLVDPFPSEQGRQRVPDSATLYKVQNKSFDSSSRSRAKARRRPRP